jgi:hypothetical protein
MIFFSLKIHAVGFSGLLSFWLAILKAFPEQVNLLTQDIVIKVKVTPKQAYVAMRGPGG